MSAEPNDRFEFEDDEIEVELVVVCACCGYPIEDETEIEETLHGEMHSSCANRLWPEG